jgi:hypothetical protein
MKKSLREAIWILRTTLISTPKIAWGVIFRIGDFEPVPRELMTIPEGETPWTTIPRRETSKVRTE